MGGLEKFLTIKKMFSFLIIVSLKKKTSYKGK
jgi:hypothetical protein